MDAFIAIKKTALVLLAALCLGLLPASAFAEENVAELKIESITTPIRGGERLNFSFIMGNRIGPPCSAQIEYWFESSGERVIQGNDAIYLETGEVRAENSTLLIPPKLEGIREFFLQMECNEATVLASRVINILAAIPKLPTVKNLDVLQNEEDKQVMFSYNIEANEGETIPVFLEERIIRDGNIAWSNSQSLGVTGKTEIKRLGPTLPVGNYKLTLELRHASTEKQPYNETVEVTKEFAIESPPMRLSLLSSLGILLGLGIATTATAFGFIRLRKKPGFALLLRRGLAKPAAIAARNMLCLVESEASGVLDDFEVNRLLDEAKVSSKKRKRCLEIAGTVPLVQIVRSCIITDKRKRVSCETTVAITVSNNSNRNWLNLVFLATIPEFLAEQVSEIEADCEMQAVRNTSIVRLKLPKVGAMQSATLSYKSAKMISQGEANSIPLPLLTSYKQGKPLVMAQVKVEGPKKEAAEGEKKALKKSLCQRGKKSTVENVIQEKKPEKNKEE